MVATTPKVKNQHFVPQFYLKRFAGTDGLIERLDLSIPKVLSLPKAPSAESVELFFYAAKTGQEDQISQDIEDFWKDIEDYVGDKIDEVEHNIVQNKELTFENLNVLANLGAMLWMRTPMFRETMNFNMGKIEKQMVQMQASSPQYAKQILAMCEKQNIPMTQKRAEEIRQFALDGKYDVTFSNNVLHLQVMISSFESFRNMFGNAKWRFQIAGGNKHFVTSTAACIEIFPEVKGFYGHGFYERPKSFPLSPLVQARIESPSKKGKKFKRKTITDNEVFEENVKQAEWSYIPNNKFSRCYARRKDELEELARFHEKCSPESSLRAIMRVATIGRELGATPSTLREFIGLKDQSP